MDKRVKKPRIPISEFSQEQIDCRTPKFWSKVSKSDDGSCWLWTGYINANGYAIMSISRRGYRASRISYFLHHGHISEDLHICHRCDNPACVRPDHLFLGTRSDNMKDSVEKGRFTKHGAKLTPDQVQAIRRDYAPGRVPAMCEFYGVRQSTIYEIIHGHTWKSTIDSPHPANLRPKGETHPSAKLTLTQVELIRAEYSRERRNSGVLAKRYGVARSVVSNIINGVSWR